MKTIRLDKFLSDNSKYTRSEIKRLVRKDKVKVNGLTVKNSDYRIQPGVDKVAINLEEIIYKKYIYLLMNKPKGVLSASNDKTRKTVVDLLPEEYRHYELFPVGRLDKDTTGLLLLTNDGDFAHKIISPKSNIEKSYVALVDAAPPKDIAEKFSKGIVLSDGSECKSAVSEVLDDFKVRIILTEGKYHQIKRMLGIVGLGVNELHRESIGKLSLPAGLKAGEFCELDINKIYEFFPQIKKTR